MINVWNNLDIQIKVAVISAVAAIVVAIITGVFSLIKRIQIVRTIIKVTVKQ